jgi:hypothetical protein
VLAAVRELHRVELLGATFRAALNAIAAAAPAWLRGVAPPDWYARYARRVEDARLPRSAAGRDAYVRTVGADRRRAPHGACHAGHADGARRTPGGDRTPYRLGAAIRNRLGAAIRAGRAERRAASPYSP